MSNSGSLYGGIDFTSVMFGNRAIHVPFNAIFQDIASDNKFAGVFQFEFDTPRLREWRGDKTHVLFMGDAILRPRVVIRSDKCQGHGISGLYLDGFREIVESVHEDVTEVVVFDK
jgi:hypothetical protein